MTTDTLPKNLHIVKDLDYVGDVLWRNRTIHATNGTYAYDAAMIVPTTLAGFQFITENTRITGKHDALVIAVNSDASMQDIMNAKNATQAERDALEDQQTRATKVALPLALQHPNRDVIVLFYGESTPNALYASLRDQGLDMHSLHKWGYGTTPDAPKIEGSELFTFTLGFPLPNDQKPVCYDITPRENQPSISVFKLTEKRGELGPYMSEFGKIVFSVNDASLEKYTQAYEEERMARFTLSSASGLTIKKAGEAEFAPEQP